MDPSLLDVLHDGPDQHLVAVGDGVDVDLDRPFQEPVHEHGMLRARRGCRPNETLELEYPAIRRVYDLFDADDSLRAVRIHAPHRSAKKYTPAYSCGNWLTGGL